MKSLLFSLLLISSQVFADYIMVGDSIFAHRGQEIKRIIEAEKKISIKNYAWTGAWFHQIVSQYYKANLQEGDILIMDGGGNDIFGNARNCRYEPTDYCLELIYEMGVKFSDVLKNAESRGIKTLVFLGPYFTRGWNGSNYEKAVNYGIGTFFAICENSKICAFVDPRKVMIGPVLEWDGIHPNQNGTKILSSLILNELK